MSDQSSIEWTDATWNPVRGCVKVSPGCKNCYAETFAERFRGVPGHPYEQGFDLRLVPEKLAEPLAWKKPRRVFVNSMSDLFQDGVPDEYIDRVLAVMALCPQHTFQVLTKRAERMREYFDKLGLRQELVGIEAERISGFDRYDVSGICARWKLPLPNCWLGVSVENQHCADERIPLLLQTPAAVRFISAEPLLGPIDLAPHFWRFTLDSPARLDWVIVGGESGPGARPFDVAWARSIVSQCRQAVVPCFVKQLGARPMIGRDDANYCVPDYELHLRSKKGGDPAEWPADLRVREFPDAH